MLLQCLYMTAKQRFYAAQAELKFQSGGKKLFFPSTFKSFGSFSVMI